MAEDPARTPATDEPGTAADDHAGSPARDEPATSPGAEPGDLRRGFAAYVAALHEAYLEAVDGAGTTATTALPLAEAPFTVAVVGGPGMHLVATRDPLPPLAAHEQPLSGQVGPLVWQVRFLDPTVVPELGSPVPAGVEPTAHVRALLGVTTSLYHLVLGPDSALTPHHAMHAGSGLANAHLAAS